MRIACRGRELPMRRGAGCRPAARLDSACAAGRAPARAVVGIGGGLRGGRGLPRITPLSRGGCRGAGEGKRDGATRGKKSS